MNDYTALALAVATATPAILLTSFLLQELRLRSAARRGWLQTYGITGIPADLKAQVKDLTEKHQMAADVNNRHTVEPFPPDLPRIGKN